MKKRKRIILIVCITILIVIGGVYLKQEFFPKHSTPILYKEGRSWTYNVTVSDSTNNITDTFSIVMRAELLDKKHQMVYEYQRAGVVFETETQAIYEDSVDIELTAPSKYIFGFTQIPPSPSADRKWSQEKWKHQSESISYNYPGEYIDKRTNDKITLQYKKIKREQIANNPTTFEYHGQAIPCYVVKGKNTNHIDDLGLFTSTYFYNHQYGFVQWIYTTPWKDTIILKLRETTL